MLTDRIDAFAAYLGENEKSAATAEKYVRDASAFAAVVNCKGKTRTVFLVKGLRKKLLRFCAEQKIKSGCIFITKTGRPIDRTTVWREMKNLCK